MGPCTNVHERSRTLANESPHTDHARDRTQAQHARGDTRQGTPARAMPQAGVTTAGDAATRTGDAQSPERGSDTKGGHLHRPGRRSRRREGRARTQKDRRGTPPRARALGSGTLAYQECHPQEQGARAAEGFAHKGASPTRAHTSGEAHACRRGSPDKGDTPTGADKGGHNSSAPAPRPTQTHRGHHSERRAHTHTHHTPTEGVWRARLSGHLGYSATR